jgi:glutamate:GABA antiporter
MPQESHLSTALAAEQTAKLRRSLRRFDVFFLLIAAVISIEVLGQISSFGGETLTWMVLLTITFLVPFALVFAEVGSAFTDEGGPYVWVKLAFGRIPAAIATFLYWVTVPVWVGGTMAFIAYETWDAFVSPLGDGTFGDYFFKLVFIWLTVTSGVASIRYGKWLPTVGAALKVGVLGFFVITAIVYSLEHGVHGITVGDLSPTVSGFLGVTPLLLFAFLGFEAANGAAGEMKNPSRDVPISLARSAAVAASCYLVPIAAILVILPAKKIDGISGLMDAMRQVFDVYGPAGPALLKIVAVVYIGVLIGQGAAWMIVSDRVQATAAADGTFFGGFFGIFNEKLGTPVRVNILTGAVATIFMFAAMSLVNGSSGAVFSVVLSFCVSTYLLSYLAIIPSAARLRRTYADTPRPFKVPLSDRAFTSLIVLCTAWIALGSWVAVFPGTLEGLLGVSYPFFDTWGVSRWTFELFTLGTLALLSALGLIGYVRARPVRGEVAGRVRHPAALPTPAADLASLND